MGGVTNLLPIVVSGSIAIDRIMRFGGRYADHIHPDKLDSLSISIFLQTMTDSPGGVGANIAYSLAMLGESPVLLGAAGHDAHAYLERLAGHGVDVAAVHRSHLPTASFNVITDGDQNQVGGFYPGAMFDSERLDLAPWREAGALVVVSPHDPVAMRRQVEQCRRWGLPLMYDVGQQVSNLEAADLRLGLDAAHVLIANDYELHALSAKTGRSVDTITRQVPVVVTTLGPAGARIAGSALPAPVDVPAVPVTTAVDPTGAGDAFRAGFLYGWRRAWPWVDCVQLGATTAAFAVEQTGTQGHQFTLADVLARRDRHFRVS